MRRLAMPAIVAAFSALGCSQVQVMTIAPGNPGNPAVVIAKDCSPSERFGAGEFIYFINEICGVKLELREDGQPVAGPMVLIGDSPALRAVAPDLSLEGLGLEGFVMKTVGPNLVLAGGKRRGSMYAVYEFLDTRLGCRWYTNEVSRIPKSNSIILGGLDVRFIPRLEYREPFYTEAFDATWSARNRMNGANSHLEDKHGGKIIYRGFVHTFASLCPLEVYFKDHPEYFSMINGQRTNDHTQLCLTNPEVVRICSEKVKEWLRATPNADIVSVSQNDWGNYCECPKCAELADREGSQSGVMLYFVNQVADNVKAEFPNVAIDTLAYQYTRSAPRHVKPRPNVIVRLCSIECSFSKTLENGEDNQSFVQDIKDWDKVCDRLFVWDYTTDFGHYLSPFPNIRVLGPNILFFADHGVKGIFEQGAYAPGGGGQDAWLKSYIIARCLWKPETDWKATMTEFLDAVYGPAAPAVQRYYDTLLDGVAKAGVEVHIFDSPAKFLTVELLEAAGKCLDEAETLAAGNEAVRKELRKVRMWWNYGMVAVMTSAYERRGDKVVFDVSGRREKIYADLMAGIKEFGVQQIREGRSVDDWASKTPKTKSESEIVILDNDKVRLEVLPDMGGRAMSFIRKSDGRNLFYGVGPGKEGYPLAEGYEGYPNDQWRSAGWNDAYTLVDRGPAHATVALDLPAMGLRLTRRYSLIPGACGFKVSASWKNISDKPVECNPYDHAGFSLGDCNDCEGWFLNAEGKWQSKSLAVGDLERGADHYYALKPQEMAGGRWLVWDKKLGLGVENHFSASAMGSVEYDWHPGQSRYDFHIMYAKKVLQPGESLDYTHSFLALDALPR
ncbi:MAG TPA: DUF4838 domain-containing protein [Candidatus Brocadiia bacterium]|nr:DUF4838 domain-containing protein [Candidatus Brocadiia bacterium]